MLEEAADAAASLLEIPSSFSSNRRSNLQVFYCKLFPMGKLPYFFPCMCECQNVGASSAKSRAVPQAVF